MRTRRRLNGNPVPVRSHRPLRVSAICASVCSVASARTCSTTAAGVTSQIRRRQRQWALDLVGGAAPPANGHSDHVVAQQGDILDQQPQHPLAVARRGARVMPDARQVGDQCRHPLLHLGRDRRRAGLVRTGVRFFGRGHPLQRLVPVPFEVVGDEPVLGAHEQKLPLRQLGVLSQPGNLRPLGAVELGGPGPQLLEHLDRDVDRRGGDGIEHKVADRTVYRRARQALALWLRAFNPPALTAIERFRMTVRHDVADRHAAAAPAADDEPLQQGHALARCAAPICAVALGAGAQRLLVRFELRPGDVAGVRVRQEDFPLIAGKPPIPRLPGEAELALTGPAIDVGSGVARIVQDVKHTVTLQLAEDQRAETGSLGDPPRPRDLLLLEVAHHRAGRAGASEGVEDEPDGALHLLVGVEHEPSAGVEDHAQRGPHPQLAAARLVQLSADQARAQHMQLRFADTVPLSPSSRRSLKWAGS